MFETLTMAHGDGSFGKLLLQLAKTDVLIIDDWGLDVLNQKHRNDLLEVMEDRHGRGATIITSQLPIEHWHEAIGDPTLADAILDRLLHNAYKIKLKGLTYKVQITETPNLYNHSAFDELSHPSTEKQPNDINLKYLVGLEKSFNNIKKVFDKAKAMGLSNAKIIPYINGLRIAEKEVQNKVVEFNDLRNFLTWQAK